MLLMAVFEGVAIGPVVTLMLAKGLLCSLRVAAFVIIGLEHLEQKWRPGHTGIGGPITQG